MKSKQLGLHVLFFKKIVTAQLPRWLVEELMKPYTIKVLISFNKLMLRREYDLFWDAFPESTHIPVGGAISMNTQIT